MALTVLLIVAFLVIVFFNVVQGLFSALLMTVLTLCCAAVAMGSFEYVAVEWLSGWRPDYAHPLALGLTFGVPLLLLRVLFDQTIRRAALLPAMVDRVGGLVFGVVTAVIIVGVFALCLHMIPFDRGSFIGYSRIDYTPPTRSAEGFDEPEPADPFKERTLFPHADSFVVAYASLVSDGVFSGSSNFRQSHPQFIQRVNWNNAAPMEVPRYAPPGSIKVLQTAVVPEAFDFTEGGRRRAAGFSPRPAEDGKYYRSIKVQLGKDAKSSFGEHVFTLRQFQLFGRDRAGGRTTHYFAIGLPAYLDPNDPANIDNPATAGAEEKFMRGIDKGYGVWELCDEVYAPLSGSNEVNLLFELPDDFIPEYLEYRLAARAPVRFEENDQAQTPTRTTPSGTTFDPKLASGAPTSGGAAPPPAGGGGGAVRGATVRVQQSHFGDALPLTLTKYQTYKNADVGRGALLEGGLIAYLVDQADGTDEPVKRLEVPESARLLHLNVDNLRARSGLGRILSQATKTIQNYTVTDDRGKTYQLVGKYAVAKVGNDELFEVQYFPNQAGTVGGVGKFEKIQDAHLTGEYELVLLFLVDPGVTIVRFSTGGSATRADDLENEGLVAPE